MGLGLGFELRRDAGATASAVTYVSRGRLAFQKRICFKRLKRFKRAKRSREVG